MVDSIKDIHRNDIDCIIFDILTRCSSKHTSAYIEHRNKSLFSRETGFSYLDVMYIFILLNVELGIELSAIRWEEDGLITFAGICDVVNRHINIKLI